MIVKTVEKRKSRKEEIPIIIREAPDSDEAAGIVTPIKSTGKGAFQGYETRANDLRGKF